MNEYLELVSQARNPQTDKTLGEEGRVLSVEEKGEDLIVKYKRDGINPADKKALEAEIVNCLKGKVAEDRVFILPQSEGSKDIYQSLGIEVQEEVSKPAQLKVGHGTVGEKRKISGVKNIIAIGSGKGGVGKSTFTTNLAVGLAKAGHKVGIVDADIYGPSLPMMLKKQNHRPQANEEQKIIPLESYGVKFISFGNFIHEDEPVVWRGPMLGGVLNQFFFETDWGELDYLLLDLPPGTGDVQLSMIQNLVVDGAIIISTPQDVALLDARKALHMFDKMDLHVIGMVENMSSFICDDCGKEHFIYGTGGVLTACNELGVGYLGKIPLELGVRKGADFGTPFMWDNEKNSEHKVYKSYQEIIKKIDDYFDLGEKKKGVFGKFFSKE